MLQGSGFSLAVAAEGQSTESKEPVELAAKELRREFQVIQEVPQTVEKKPKWGDP